MHDAAIEERWQEILRRLQEETRGLTPAEWSWIRPRLAALACLQERLQELFVAAAGADCCAACRGGCCGDGRNHATLVAALSYLAEREPLPPADFDKPCPFLGPKGCRMPTGRRPFNCITFYCEAVDTRLSAADRALFHDLERELRSRYQEFERRYAGAGLQGLLLRSGTLGSRPFLERIDRPD